MISNESTKVEGGSRQVEESAAGLADLAAQLSSLVDRFKVDRKDDRMASLLIVP